MELRSEPLCWRHRDLGAVCWHSIMTVVLTSEALADDKEDKPCSQGMCSLGGCSKFPSVTVVEEEEST